MTSARALAFTFFAIIVLLSSALAHEAIDLAGDVLLAHDTYDGLPHDSRVLFTAAALIALGCAAFGCVLRALDSSGRFDLPRAALRVQRHARAEAIALCSATLAIVPLMEWADATLAGARIDGIGDLYGGSVLLGAVGCIAAALTIGLAVVRCARWLCSYERHIIRLIGRLMRRHSATPPFVALRCRRMRPNLSARTPIARNRALRAPPPALA